MKKEKLNNNTNPSISLDSSKSFDDSINKHSIELKKNEREIEIRNDNFEKNHAENNKFLDNNYETIRESERFTLIDKIKNTTNQLKLIDSENKEENNIEIREPQLLNQPINILTNTQNQVKQKKKKKQLEKKELLNREKSKLACLIRKKYTALFKESIKQKNKTEKYYCCNFFRKMTKKTFYKFISIAVQGFISFLSIVVYVMGTYYDEDDPSNDEVSLIILQILKWLELFIALVITIEYIIKLIKRKNKWEFILKYLNILDIIAVIPTYLGLILQNFKGLGFTRVFRMVRLLRIFKIYKTVTDSRKDKNEEEKNVIFMRLLSAIFTVLAFVFLSTGIVHFLNQNLPDYFRIIIPSLDSYLCQSGNPFNVTEYEAFREGYRTELRCNAGDELIKVHGKMTFDLVFYYMVITMATVGYGDIYPDTSWMRLVIGLFVILSIITISKQTSELNDLIKLNSEYQVAYKQSSHIKHILLSGFFNKSSLVKFLNEFYHSDHQDKSENTKIIIVQSEYPDKEIQSILLNPKFEENLHYIIGDIFSENTLKLANVAKAEAIFLISDQHDPDSIKNDQYLILACKALSQYTSAKIYIQFNHSQFLLHEWVDWDLAFSSQKIKMNIIVKNSFISGLSTMIMNLSCSSSSIYNYEVNSPWMLEYIHGASQEIYIIEIPSNFQECSFKDFVLRSYFNHRSLIIGVKKKIKYKEDKDIFYFIYLLNPVDYILTNEDSLIIISSTFESAKEIFNEYSNTNTSFDKFINKPDNKLDNFKNYKEFFRDENLDNKKKKSNENIYHANEDNGKEIKKRFIKEIDDIDDNLDLTTNKNNFEISDIFKNRQYFKIWENNPVEFERSLINHYIIFCKEDQLWEFMIYFNQYHSDVIFFISDQHPSNKLMLTKRYFKNLIYIECSYSDQDDLIRLKLEQAKQVYILTYTVENSNVSDSGILPLIKIIEENFPNCNYTLELSDELNIRYMNNKGLDSDDEDDEIDLNVMTKEKTNQLIKKKNKVKNIPVRLLPKFAKSDIFFCSSMESLLAFSYHNDGFLEVLSKLLGIDNDSNQLSENKMSENQDITMYRYVGSKKLKYEHAIYYFLNLNRPIIPIAIYRMKSDATLKNKLPYIITNPEKNFMLNKLDKIICIGETSFSERFENFSEAEFEETKKKNENSESDSSFEYVTSQGNKRRNGMDRRKKSENKEINKADELENLNEEELLEKLRIEINNLKFFSQLNRNSTTTNLINEYETKNQENLNFQRGNFDNIQGNNSPFRSMTSKHSNKLKKNFFNKDEINIIEEKFEENDENCNIIITNRNNNDESQNNKFNKSNTNISKYTNKKYKIKDDGESESESQVSASSINENKNSFIYKKKLFPEKIKKAKNKFFSDNALVKLSNKKRNFDNENQQDDIKENRSYDNERNAPKVIKSEEKNLKQISKFVKSLNEEKSNKLILSDKNSNELIKSKNSIVNGENPNIQNFYCLEKNESEKSMSSFDKNLKMNASFHSQILKNNIGILDQYQGPENKLSLTEHNMENIKRINTTFKQLEISNAENFKL